MWKAAVSSNDVSTASGGPSPGRPGDLALGDGLFVKGPGAPGAVLDPALADAERRIAGS
jgi:hypothetical protein